MVVAFDYNALNDAQSQMKKLDGYWDELQSYGRDLKSSISDALDEWRISGSEPYGNRYLESAQCAISDKKTYLNNEADAWGRRAANIDDFVEYVQDRDTQVKNDLSMLMREYVDYSGFFGFFRGVHDSIKNYVQVDLANSCAITRELMEFVKEKNDDLEDCLQDVEDWFQHGNGKYVLNIVGAVVGTVAAVAGAVAGIVAAPFSGGASLAATVACVGAIAGGIAAAMTAFNAGIQIGENIRALGTDNPGEARFYGNVDGFSEFVNRTDLGDAEDNARWETAAKVYDTVHATAEVTSVVCGGLTSFGTKEVVVDGKKVLKYDFSKQNVLNNIKKSMGIKIEKIEEVEVNASTIEFFENAGDAQGMMVFKGETDINMSKISATASDDAIGFSMNRMSNHSEYGGIVLSDGVKTSAYTEYVSASNSSSLSVDIEFTNSAKKIKSQNATDNLTKWLGKDRAAREQEELYNFVKSVTDLSDKTNLAIDLINEDDNKLGVVAYSKFTDTKAGKFISDYIIDYKFEEGHYKDDHFDFASKWSKLGNGFNDISKNLFDVDLKNIVTNASKAEAVAVGGSGMGGRF